MCVATDDAKPKTSEAERLAKIGALGKSIRRGEERLARERAELAAELVDATDDGVKQVDMVKAIDFYTRERVRQMVKAERDRRAEEAAEG